MYENLGGRRNLKAELGSRVRISCQLPAIVTEELLIRESNMFSKSKIQTLYIESYAVGTVTLL